MKEEVKVKKLDIWETEKIYKPKTSIIINFKLVYKGGMITKDHRNILTNNEMESLNFYINAKEDISKINLKSNYQLQDFFKRNSEGKINF